MSNPYLTKEEQYRKILNNEEIERIEDPELRAIRSKYWNLQHEAFVDEANIPDRQLEEVSNHIFEEEQEEIATYRQRKGE